MKFYDRESELELLEKVIKGKGTCIVVIRGFRRIGKTRSDCHPTYLCRPPKTTGEMEYLVEYSSKHKNAYDELSATAKKLSGKKYNHHCPTTSTHNYRRSHHFTRM